MSKWVLMLRSTKTAEEEEQERLEREWANFEDQLCRELFKCERDGRQTMTLDNSGLDDEQCDAARKQLEDLFGKDCVREPEFDGQFISQFIITSPRLCDFGK